MVEFQYLDSAEAMAAVVVLKQFGLNAYATGRESDSGQDEPPMMVWTVHAPELRDTPKPERDEVDDYIETRWDREAEERMFGPRNRIYRGDL